MSIYIYVYRYKYTYIYKDTDLSDDPAYDGHVQHLVRVSGSVCG